MVGFFCDIPMGCCIHDSTLLQITPPQFMDSETTSWTSPHPGKKKKPTPSPHIPWHIPLGRSGSWPKWEANGRCIYKCVKFHQCCPIFPRYKEVLLDRVWFSEIPVLNIIQFTHLCQLTHLFPGIWGESSWVYSVMPCTCGHISLWQPKMFITLIGGRQEK